MYGVSKITSEQNVMLTTFPNLRYNAENPAVQLQAIAQAGIVVDMICQSVPRGDCLDFSFTTSQENLAAIMQVLSTCNTENPPMISSGYVKINLYGADMVMCSGVAARVLETLAAHEIPIVLITTSDVDISLLLRAEDEDAALKALQNAFGL